jgi:hypothetical protein
MKSIYIAGKVSGEPIAECTMKFGTAQKEIENQGFKAINPLEVVGDWQTPWQPAMKLCLLALICCDAILLLDDWQDSRGAMIEQKLAQDLGIKILIGTKDLAKRV